MNMNDLKRDYEAIAVPEDLESRIRLSMQQESGAAADGRGEKTAADRSNIRRFHAASVAKWAGIAAAFALALTGVLANGTASTSYAVSHVPVIGNIAKVMTFRSFSDTTNDMSASVDTPVVADENGSTDGKAASVNADIQSYADKVIDDYKALVAETSGQAKDSVEVTSKTLTDNADFLILGLSTTETAADSAESMKTYCIQKSTGDVLSLSDMFAEGTDWDAALTAEVQKQMRERMAADPDNTIYFIDSDMPEDDFTGLSDDQNFYINSDGDLVLVFDEGAVAPMYMGVQEFVIPAEAIDSIEIR